MEKLVTLGIILSIVIGLFIFKNLVNLLWDIDLYLKSENEGYKNFRGKINAVGKGVLTVVIAVAIISGVVMFYLMLFDTVKIYANTM